MYVHYIRNFALGKSTHIVKVYENYTEERGLIGEPIISRNDGRISECLKQLPISKLQIEAVRSLARDRQDMIIHPDGRKTSC